MYNVASLISPPPPPPVLSLSPQYTFSSSIVLICHLFFLSSYSFYPSLLFFLLFFLFSYAFFPPPLPLLNPPSAITGEEAGERCAQYFRAHTFAALLEKDPFGRISINTFFKYVMRREWLKQVRSSLMLPRHGSIIPTVMEAQC